MTPTGKGPQAARWTEFLLAAPAASEDDLAAALCALGALGVRGDGLPGPGGSITLRAAFDPPPADDAGIRAAAAAWGGSVVGREAVEDGRWVERWIEALRPFDVGRRFRVVPVRDLEDPPGEGTPVEGRIPLRICPSRAFGTGEHPTTRLCLERLEALELRGRSFLDAGTGSGILAIAAAALGARPCEGFDNDPEAIEVAAANARLNGLEGALSFRVAEPADRLGSRHDVVAANLNGTILARLLIVLRGLTAPGGRLVLSGILESEADELARASARCGLVPLRTDAEGGWVSILLAPGGAP